MEDKYEDGRRNLNLQKLIREFLGPEVGPPKPYPPQARLTMRRGRRFRRYLHRTGYLARIVKRKVLPLREKILVLEGQQETLIRYVESLKDENLRLRQRIWKLDPTYGREEEIEEEEDVEGAQPKSSIITIKNQ